MVFETAFVLAKFQIKLQCLESGEWQATCALFPKLKPRALCPNTARHRIGLLIEEELPKALRRK